MKKTLLIILLLVCAYNLKAAEYEYVPLVREGAEWSYVADKRGFGTESVPDEYYRVRMSGDAVVNGITYKKVYRYNQSSFNENEATLTAYMREDNRKVYMIPVAYGKYDLHTPMKYEIGKEYMLYDFGGNGDSKGNITIEIDGKLRNVYNNVESYIIEGVGPVNKEDCGDFIYPYPPIPTGDYYVVSINYERNLTTNKITYTGKYFRDSDPTADYTPLVRETGKWSYAAYMVDMPGVEPVDSPLYYRAVLSGETVINGKIYMNAYRFADCYFDIKKTPITAYMREEDRKVYMIPITKGFYDSQRYEEGKEYFLYDYNLNVGDNTAIGLIGNDLGNEITAIKTIKVNGKDRKEFVTPHYSIIEGMGIVGEHGCFDFIYPLQAIPSGWGYRNVVFNYESNYYTDEIVYKSPFYNAKDDCTAGVDILKADLNMNIKVLQGKIEVSVAGAACQSIEIVNMTGQTVRKSICDNEPTSTISTTGIASGTYIVVVNTDKGISTKKAIL